MIWLKYSLLILSFLILAVLQSSFFAYVNFIGPLLNIVFVLFFILIFFEKKTGGDLGFWISVFAGFLLDLFSWSYFGVSIVSLLIVYLLLKLSKYFLMEGNDKSTIIYFVPLFMGSFIAYNVILYVASSLFKMQVNYIWGSHIIFAILLNTIIAVLGFYAYKNTIGKYENDSQLKLL